jgi:hypothetical protein
MVSLQWSSGIAASQTFVAVTLAEAFELLNGKVPTTGVPRSSPFAKIVGLVMPYPLGIILCPLFTASYYVFTLAFVVTAFGSVYALLVVRCPDLLVLGQSVPCVLPGTSDAPQPDGANSLWLSHIGRTALSVHAGTSVHAP